MTSTVDEGLTLAALENEFLVRRGDHVLAGRIASMLFARAEPLRAVPYLRLASEVSGRSERARYLFELARAYEATHPESAISYYEQSVAAGYRVAAARKRIAFLLRYRMGDASGAILSLTEVVRADRSDIDAWTALTVVALERGMQPVSVSNELRVMAGVEPEGSAKVIALAQALQDMGRYEEASRCWRDVLAEEHQRAVAFLGLAICAERTGDSSTAESLYSSAVRANPADLRISAHRTMFLFAQERFDEARLAFLSFERIRPARAPKAWDGSTVEGKSFVLSAHAGFGDIIHFARIAQWLRREGARNVAMVSQFPLKDLLARVDGVDESWMPYDRVLDGDYTENLMSVFIKAPVAQTMIAACPYLLVPRGSSTQFPLGDRRPRVGLVWSSGMVDDINPSTSRNAPLSDFGGLLSTGGVKFVCMQKGPGRDELRHSPLRNKMIDLTHELNTFDHTAAALTQIDLLITVDTSIVHVAGAMCVPTVVLLPHHADWRWASDVETSKWYPSVRLLRQQERGNWSFPIDQATQQVLELQANRIALADRPGQP